tara:strand:- start:8066 stop:8791 length:726 start_codon:yes stop_codon:yes gene_type:complete
VKLNLNKYTFGRELKLLVSIFLIAIGHLSYGQFVDTLHLTVDRGYSVFGISNHNCKENHFDLGCKMDGESTCFVCKVAENETDSILMYKTRIHDSLYIYIHDKKGTLRLKYLQPHGKSIIGRVHVYDKKGDLISKEYYSYGHFHEDESPNHHNINQDKPFRSGVWEYYKKGELVKKERYELLHTKDASSYFILVKEYEFHKGSTHVKRHNEYIVGIEDFVYFHKPVKFKNPVYSVKGRNAN